MSDLFDRLDAKRPPAEEKTAQPDPAQKLLDWLQTWNKPTICTRDICIWGPSATRKRKSAIDAAEVLVRHGWLIPIKAHRYDRRVWQIARRPVIHPTVEL